MVESLSQVKKHRLISISPAERENKSSGQTRVSVTLVEQLGYMADHLDEMSRRAFEIELETLGGLLRLARDEARLQRDAACRAAVRSRA